MDYSLENGQRRLMDVRTPAGIFRCSISEGAITEVEIRQPEETGPVERERDREDRTVTDELIQWTNTYFSGNQPSFTPPVRPEGTAFQREVWQHLMEIPYGETVSYGELAKRIGRPNAARAVGQACGANPVLLLVPCHRVVRADGTPGGYAGPEAVKRTLLTIES